MKDIEKLLQEEADKIVLVDAKSRIERVLKRIEAEKASSAEQETQTEENED